MRRHIGLIAAFLAGALLMLAGACFQQTAGADARGWLRILSNAALFPGVLLMGFGLLAWISGEGVFDGLKYSFSAMWTHLRGGKKKYASYYEYMNRTRQRAGVGFLLIPGGAFLLAAVLLAAAYYLVA